MKKNKSELEHIPGVGISIAQDLQDLGMYHIGDLKGKSPEGLYEQLNTLRGMKIDRCMLYVFRCAVYFAETENPDPKLLKWWNWKETI